MKTSLKYYLQEPLQYKNWALFSLRVLQKLHDVTNGRSSIWYNKLFVRKITPPSFPAEVEQLFEKGWALVDKKISAADIATLISAIQTIPVWDRVAKKYITLNDFSGIFPSARYIWPMQEVIKLAPVQALATDPTIHAIAQGYLHTVPKLVSITLWLDPLSTETESSHIYHYDNDGPGFLKFFICLTDFTEGSGTHTFVESSHRKIKPKPFAISQRYDETDILNFYGRNKEIRFNYPAGTIFAEDTCGFHKGTKITQSYRLLLQFEFSVVDIPHQEELVQPLVPVKLLTPFLKDSIKQSVKKFYE